MTDVIDLVIVIIIRKLTYTERCQNFFWRGRGAFYFYLKI